MSGHNQYEGEVTVSYLDWASPYGIGEAVYDVADGQELWQMRQDREAGKWVKDKLLRKRKDRAMSAAVINHRLFPKVDESEVAV